MFSRMFMIDGVGQCLGLRRSRNSELLPLSTTEAEYIAQTHVAKEVFSDSKSAVALAHDGHYRARTKPIEHANSQKN